ncbi:PHP domain-containing protein [Candidatus Gracilibacteria bacterium]|nr:PHP domain-containing protein [Candidatus Gracilibacteria bacterium]
MKVDMHFHSNLSDGYLSKDELIKRAYDQKLDFIALTDHDRVSYGFADEVSKYGIKSTNSVEISSYNKKHNKSLHLTFYAKEISKEIKDKINEVIEAKVGLIKKQVDFFNQIGFQIDLEEMYKYYVSFGRKYESLNKFDIVRFMFLNPNNVLLAQKINDGNKIDVEGFYLKFLKRGGEKFDKYAVIINDYEVPIETCLDFVNKTSGVLSMAHPNVTFRKGGIEEFERVLPYYIENSGINAIEINAKATKIWVESILKNKEKYGLYLTFGSDFHKDGLDDGKHGYFGEQNEFISSELLKESFLEYEDKIIKKG